MIGNWNAQNSLATRAGYKSNHFKSKDVFPQAIQIARDVATSLQDLSTRGFQNHAQKLRHFSQAKSNRKDESLLALVSGTVCEAAQRLLGFKLFDEQLMAGAAVSMGATVEMQTGEGKTLALAIPACYHALTGHAVHVVTSNHYLAGRDCRLLKPVFDLMQLSVGLLVEDASVNEKRDAYDADLTYGPAHAFGFDYLSDQLTLGRIDELSTAGNIYRRVLGQGAEKELLQRGLHTAIIDEADHVLIDDAVSPLILSEMRSDLKSPDAPAHLAARTMMSQLEPELDFTLVEPNQVQLTPRGFQSVYQDATFAMFPGIVRPWHEYVVLALKADYCFQRDMHYVVRDHQVQIVDISTGRIFESRNWADGLHQAMEAKEGLEISCESRPLARITRQRFYRNYKQVCGITGTASGCEKELAKNYGTPVVEVPVRLPSQRNHWETHFSESQSQKQHAIVAETQQCIESHRAVLIGTPSIAESHAISQLLETKSIPHHLLNGVQDAGEAEVIAHAGRVGAVTVATNMAGRGTDIKLEEQVAASGGLHVIVTQMHSFGRVDRQLIGRCGRCGDPGSFRFFVASDDPLPSTVAPWIGRAIRRLSSSNGAAAASIHAYLASAQKKQERVAASLRWRMLQADRDTQRLLEKSKVPRRCFSLVG
ncbi:preprotein translocase subunit SecA [bacterium]|nr:preprotein translocase subunit SecA [bacterium]MDB4664491.1 preprotein translocase subunit SecA [bacterium]